MLKQALLIFIGLSFWHPCHASLITNFNIERDNGKTTGYIYASSPRQPRDITQSFEYANARLIGGDVSSAVGLFLKTRVFCRAFENCRSEASASAKLSYEVEIKPKADKLDYLTSLYEDVTHPFMQVGFDYDIWHWINKPSYVSNRTFAGSVKVNRGSITYRQGVGATLNENKGTIRTLINPLVGQRFKISLEGRLQTRVTTTERSKAGILIDRKLYVDPVVRIDPSLQDFFDISQTAIPNADIESLNAPVSVPEPSSILLFILALPFFASKASIINRITFQYRFNFSIKTISSPHFFISLLRRRHK